MFREKILQIMPVQRRQALLYVCEDHSIEGRSYHFWLTEIFAWALVDCLDTDQGAEVRYQIVKPLVNGTYTSEIGSLDIADCLHQVAAIIDLNDGLMRGALLLNEEGMDDRILYRFGKIMEAKVKELEERHAKK